MMLSAKIAVHDIKFLILHPICHYHPKYTKAQFLIKSLKLNDILKMARLSQCFIQDKHGKLKLGINMLDELQLNQHNDGKRVLWLSEAGKLLASLKNQDSQTTNNAWSQSFTITTSLLKQAHTIIKNSENRIQELERLSMTDELTGVTNRRGFLKSFNRELDRVERGQSQGGLLIMIDLDNFKAINDNYGHDAGDMALKIVASTLANDIRLMDIVSRMGGDEFIISFANTDRQAALERAQYLIKKLNNLSFVWNGEEISVRASLGLREYKKGCKAHKIFSDADKDMYENKKQIKELNLRKQNARMV